MSEAKSVKLLRLIYPIKSLKIPSLRNLEDSVHGNLQYRLMGPGPPTFKLFFLDYPRLVLILLVLHWDQLHVLPNETKEQPEC